MQWCSHWLGQVLTWPSFSLCTTRYTTGFLRTESHSTVCIYCFALHNSALAKPRLSRLQFTCSSQESCGLAQAQGWVGMACMSTHVCTSGVGASARVLLCGWRRSWVGGWAPRMGGWATCAPMLQGWIQRCRVQGVPEIFLQPCVGHAGLITELFAPPGFVRRVRRKTQDPTARSVTSVHGRVQHLRG